MIERPTPAGAVIAQAGAEASEAANVAPAPPASVADPAVPGALAERTPHLLAASGPDPALAPCAPPRFPDRPGPRFEDAARRPTPRRTPRAAAGMEGMSYRVVFACCTEATDTPIK